MRETGGAGNGQYNRRTVKEPCERELRNSRAVSLRCFRQRAAGAANFACRERKPRDESQFVFGAVVEDVLALTISEVVEILHTDDRHDFPRLLNLIYGNLG